MYVKTKRNKFEIQSDFEHLNFVKQQRNQTFENDDVIKSAEDFKQKHSTNSTRV